MHLYMYVKYIIDLYIYAFAMCACAFRDAEFACILRLVVTAELGIDPPHAQGEA